MNHSKLELLLLLPAQWGRGGGRNSSLARDTPPAVTAKIGTSFGVRFQVVGSPANAPVSLKAIWKIPAPGIINPANGNTYRESVSEIKTTIGGIGARGYGLDNSWEIVTGVWTLEIWQNNRKLLERSFTIQ